MVDGAPTLVANSKEFVASAEQAWARIAPAIDRRVKELTGIQTVLYKRVAEARDDARLSKIKSKARREAAA
jgi:hypothetical protein